MLYQIQDGTVSFGSGVVLSHIDFAVRGRERIAVVGRNGSGKTTLLRLIAGEIALDRDDKRMGSGIMTSRKISVGFLKQEPYGGNLRTVEEELLYFCPAFEAYDRERFSYEQEYNRLFTGFGFAKEDKKKRLSTFSGGEQTKIALIRLLLEKPDILLLDEPTNHLDLDSCSWLEEYLKSYEKAVVMVSHDRFFLDRTAEVVYELSNGTLTRYNGNYSSYREQKLKQAAIQRKAFKHQQEEIARLNQVAERFKTKPRKAAFAKAKKKAIERMERIALPQEDEASIYSGEIIPRKLGGKWVLEAEDLKIGYDIPVAQVSLRIRRGQKIGILGKNGVGKTTFLKTIAGLLPPLEGKYTLGTHISAGYFDQHCAELESEKAVIDYFHDLYPSLTEKEARGILASYLFFGKDVQKRVSSLSGGEKARLKLAVMLQDLPNFLILDEPTNHMDIYVKETLESIFQAYKGTILFVSHDRYFIRQVAESMLIFDEQSVMYYPFGYEHYLEHCQGDYESITARIQAKEQALIEGIRAVPKAERFRGYEPVGQDAYLEWQLLPALEKLQDAAEEVERLEGSLARLSHIRMNTEAVFVGGSWEYEEEYKSFMKEHERAMDDWNTACLEWYDLYDDLLRDGGELE